MRIYDDYDGYCDECGLSEQWCECDELEAYYPDPDEAYERYRDIIYAYSD